MKIGVFEEENRSVRVALDVVGDVAVKVVAFDNRVYVVIVEIGGTAFILV